MKINLTPSNTLDDQIANLKGVLQVPKDITMEFVLDQIHGLNEVSRSLAQLHPHKKSIAILGVQPPPISEIILGFASDGFLIQEIPVSFFQFDPKILTQTLEILKKDTLFVIATCLEPMTGCFYPIDEIKKECFKKNIFFLSYYSPDALKRGLVFPESPFVSVIADPLWGQSHAIGLAFKGERCVGERVLWGKSTFSKESIDALKKELLRHDKTEKDSIEDKTSIINFENEIKMILGTGSVDTLKYENRLYDRAVLFIKGVDGESLSTRLSSQGFKSYSSAACAWNDHQVNLWLPRLGIDAEKVQSSVFIPLSTLKLSGIKEALVKLVGELRKISGFS